MKELAMFDGSFEPFSRTPEYIEVNRACALSWSSAIGRGESTRVHHVLDIATGVGTMANIFVDALTCLGHNLTLTCLDSSKWALELARRNVRTDGRRVSFVCADMRRDELSGSFDVIVWANGIHYLFPDEQRAALSKMTKVLRPGGYFCFNTAFHTEAMPVETRPFYSVKVKEASRLLHARNAERVRGLEKKAAAQPQPKSHYLSLVEGAGLKLVGVEEHTVHGSLHFWQAIASFHDYAEGALTGYPVGEAAEALVESTEISFNQHASNCDGERFIERRWLSVIAS